MNTFLGASWKTKIAGILTLIGPTGLWFILTACKMSETQATAISGAVFTILASYGLYNAKQVGVSNAPMPLTVDRQVTDVPIHAAAPADTAGIVRPEPNPSKAAKPVVVVK